MFTDSCQLLHISVNAFVVTYSLIIIWQSLFDFVFFYLYNQAVIFDFWQKYSAKWMTCNCSSSFSFFSSIPYKCKIRHFLSVILLTTYMFDSLMFEQITFVYVTHYIRNSEMWSRSIPGCKCWKIIVTITNSCVTRDKF